jgi:predicted nucleic acid-binding protein
VEARQTWDRRSSEHNALQNQLQPIIRQIARSEPFRTVTESSRELLSALLASGEDTRLRLEETITALSSAATILPLDADIVFRGRQKELDLALSPSDAVVYATVLSHLQAASSGVKRFLNRDSKGFANPSVYDELANFDCKLIVSFEKGLDFIRSEIR